jgi:DUF4097 and DUF4098 domain-containing protein YvlB
MKKMMKKLVLALSAAAMICAAGCANPAVAYEHADQYTPGDFSTNSTIRELDIDWTSGIVAVSHHDQPDVTVTETCNASLKDEQKLQTWLEGSTLHIRFCRPGVNFDLKNADKKLEVKLPNGMELDTLNCDCTSADTTFTDISAKTIAADVTSGILQLSGCSASDFEIDSTSGDVTVDQKGSADTLKVTSTSGKLLISAETVKTLNLHSTSGDTDLSVQQSDSVSAESTSGNETLHFSAVPASVDVDTTSGKAALFVPESADFKAAVDTASGKFDSDISLKKDGDTYTAGSGSNQINIETTSGDISISAEG